MASDGAPPIVSPQMDFAAEDAGPPARPSVALGYGLSLFLTAAAGLVAFVVDQIVSTPNLSLIFVLPVIVAALSFGWGPALIAAMLGVAIDDFFFIEPRFTFRVASPSDVWALVLLLVVAAIASTVGAQSRGRALANRRAAEQAEALHSLAHAVIEAQPPSALLKIAAVALSRIFEAPAVVLAEKAGKLWPAAIGGGGEPSAADLEAAHWSLANDKPTRGESYPFDQAVFDFWPVQTPACNRLVLGVRLEGLSAGRPNDPARQVELVAAYLSAAAAKGTGAEPQAHT